MSDLPPFATVELTSPFGSFVPNPDISGLDTACSLATLIGLYKIDGGLIWTIR
jgi:hypothetical protein